MNNNNNKIIPEDNEDKNLKAWNFSTQLPIIFDGRSSTSKGIKINHPKNQIQTEQYTENTILVAEDDLFNFFVIESCLIPYNCKIIHARDGKEAVRIFNSREEISLVLMDIQMPVMDGFTATKEIRKIDENIPIIAQTSFDYDEIRKRAHESGCNDFLTKPIDTDLLIHKIKKHIKIKKNNA